MTGAVLADKLAGTCTRAGCRERCRGDVGLCEPHRADNAARWSLWAARHRSQRRARGQCIGCGRACEGQRCGVRCGPRQLQLQLEVAHVTR